MKTKESNEDTERYLNKAALQERVEETTDNLNKTVALMDQTIKEAWSDSIADVIICKWAEK